MYFVCHVAIYEDFGSNLVVKYLEDANKFWMKSITIKSLFDIFVRHTVICLSGIKAHEVATYLIINMPFLDNVY